MLRYLVVLFFVAALGAQALEQDFQKLVVDKKYTIPKFKGDVPSVFDDIAYSAPGKKFVLANQAGMGEFPLAGGEIAFAPPAFTAACPGWGMQGFVVFKDGKYASLALAKKAISLSSGGSATNLLIPEEIKDPSGLAHDGKHFLLADRSSKTVFRLKPTSDNTALQVVSKLASECASLEAVAFHEGVVWTSGGEDLVAYDDQDKVLGRFRLPEKVSGLTLAASYLWLTSKDKPQIYRIKVPELKTVPAKN